MSGIPGMVLRAGLPTFALVLIIALLIAYEAGHRLGRWRASIAPLRDPEVSGVGSITAGMLALLAFVLGLTIAFAQSRFEERRQLVVSEANAISTAWLQARATGTPEGARIASLLESYARVRLAFIDPRRGTPSESTLNTRTSALQNEIWHDLSTLVQRAPTPVSASLMSALNETFDLALSQRFAFTSPIPRPVTTMLILGSLLSIGALGYQTGATGRQQLILTLMLLAMWAGAMVVIADLGDPRIGIIRPDPAPLLWTIQGFSSPPPAAR